MTDIQERTIMSLPRESFPIIINFNNKKYVLYYTRKGGLVLNMVKDDK